MKTKHKDIATDNLRILLKKLGVRSAVSTWGAFNMETLQEWIKRVQGNFGMPDEILMNPQSYDAFHKQFKKNK